MTFQIRRSFLENLTKLLFQWEKWAIFYQFLLHYIITCLRYFYYVVICEFVMYYNLFSQSDPKI